MRIAFQGIKPKKAHDTDAAFDLRSAHRSLIEPRGVTVIACGVLIDIPAGHVGLVCSRSGMALNHGVFVLNAPGVVDPGYHGEICVILANFSERVFEIESGDRIAQLLVCPTSEVEFVSNYNAFTEAETSRGAGGFGSTGMSDEDMGFDGTVHRDDIY